MNKKPEGCIKSACLRYLKRRGFFVWNNPSGCLEIRQGKWMHFGKKGSDIIGVLPGGRFLAIETKANYGRLTPDQVEFLDRVRNLGGIALVAKNWKDIDTALRREGLVDDGPLFQ